MQERHNLVTMMRKAVHDIPSEAVDDGNRYFEELERLAERMEHWRNSLPDSLCYTSDMPSPLFEIRVRCCSCKPTSAEAY